MKQICVIGVGYVGVVTGACFADLGYKPGQFPNTEQACAEVLALPIFPELSDAQIQRVADTVLAFYGR